MLVARLGASQSRIRLETRVRDGLQQILNKEHGWAPDSDVPAETFSVAKIAPLSRTAQQYRARFAEDLAVSDSSSESEDDNETAPNTFQLPPADASQDLKDAPIDAIVGAVVVDGQKFFAGRNASGQVLIPATTAMRTHTALVVEFLERVVKWDDLSH